ncbi:MAG: beta-propeller domain-containing protein [Methylococcales bacterium]|nr:beta-propeller domain-containing protein [Methylococcales bacterium]
MSNKSPKYALLVTGLLAVVALGPVSAASVNPYSPKINFKDFVSQSKKLKPQKIASNLALANLLAKRHTNHYANYFLKSSTQPGVFNMVANDSSGGAELSHTDTNIQVQGVDESDLLKVGDDGYIYQVYNNQVRIIKGFPVADLNQVATLTFSDSNFYPTGIYIKAGKLVVLGSSWQMATQTKMANPAIVAIDDYNPGWYWRGTQQARVLIYDLADHTKPTLVRDVAIDGDFLDSRVVGDNLYFITRSYPDFYRIIAQTKYKANTLAAKPATMLPTISDTKKGKIAKKTLALKDLSYFPDFVEPNYVMASSLNLAHPEQALNTKAYLGAGELVYASQKSLYLSASNYNFDSATVDAYFSYNPSTQIYKYAINNGQIAFEAAGQVAGTALNQFSMDENGDYFRIATTSQNWNAAGNASTSSLFVLDKNMTTVGKIENLAKGEQIYATRFLGDRCYIVTFKLVDPLFAIDLSTPTQPKVLGELKIPGYSNYLHPYDETHLIGFGKDAAVYQSEQANSDQFWAGGSAFYQGLKVALFDVADMANPKELHSITIGDRGSLSPLLWNHKALYWDAERHLFGFPVDLAALAGGFDATKPWQYGLPVYQGAYIYQVSPENGFTLQAKLSQIPEDKKPVHVANEGYEYGYWDLDTSDYFVDRILRIDNSLYTVSNKQVSVYGLSDFGLQASLPLTP